MDKDNFNVECFKNNKVAINCKTLEEAEQFKEILRHYDIADKYSTIFYFGFERYGQDICYEYENNGIHYGSRDFFKNENYEILDFTGFSDTQFSNKTTILSQNIKLKNGDIINNKNYGYGMVINDIIIYAKHYGWNIKTGSVLNNITEYLPFEILKQQYFYEEYKGCIVERLLFRNELEDSIKPLMIKVEKPIPKTKTKIYTVNRNKYSLSYTDKYTSYEMLNLKDMCCIDTGLLKGKYGRVIGVAEECLTKEEISKYDKIIKVN